MEARQLAHRIWQAGVDRVRAGRLIAETVVLDPVSLTFGEQSYGLETIDRICIIGAGKAAGQLGIALSQTLTPLVDPSQSSTVEPKVFGHLNVPANCVEANPCLRLHAARPAGANEPREEGVQGTSEILRMVEALRPNDLCVCLITGGGSALLPAPTSGISLADKLLVTRLMSHRGASIQELNCVRIALSDIKGGGLLRACRADRLVTLLVSDIIGDPLDLIASGPTIRPSSIPHSPTSVLRRYVKSHELSKNVWDVLERTYQRRQLDSEREASDEWKAEQHTVLLGNNATAVKAARDYALSLGLEPIVVEPETANTTAEAVAESLIEKINHVTRQASSQTASKATCKGKCIIWGGEPIVSLHASPGMGGRNQQLALAVMAGWQSVASGARKRLCVLSGGTDGEDGPTDAAGAFVDEAIVNQAIEKKLDLSKALERNDAYPVFEATEGLLKKGPTHTNVCDLRVAVLL